jgi:hypothetical protein
MGTGALLTSALLLAIGALAATSSVVFNWASGKSAVWNMGLAIAIALLLATGLIVAIVIMVARLGY